MVDIETSGITARIELASRNAETGDTLYTFVLRYPRIIHSEIMTHRVFSRNAASSRAIPCKKLRRIVLDDPAVPFYLGANQKGMQAGEDIKGWRYNLLRGIYKAARYPAVAAHWLAEKLGAHKQFGNRLLEPWMWMEVVLSATELDNFYSLRCHKDAEPHFQELAKAMRELTISADRILNEVYCLKERRTSGSAYGFDDIGFCQILKIGEWHTPFIEDASMPLADALIVSPARSARVSWYLPESGKLSTLDQDKSTYNKLAGSTPIHASPFEHVAQVLYRKPAHYYGNFDAPFAQLRGLIQ